MGLEIRVGLDTTVKDKDMGSGYVSGEMAVIFDGDPIMSCCLCVFILNSFVVSRQNVLADVVCEFRDLSL